MHEFAVRYAVCGIFLGFVAPVFLICKPANGMNKMFSETTILVVSGRAHEPATIARVLADNYRVLEADSLADAAAQISNGVQLVVTDLASSNSDGLELLRREGRRHPATAFLAIASEGDVHGAVEAMKAGANDCVAKPVNADELQAAVSRLLRDRSGKAGGDSDSEREQPSHIDIPPGTSLEELERAAVEQALTEHNGNRTHAAKTLGISVRTLQRKLKAWGMPLGAAQNASSSGNNYILPSNGGHQAFSAHAH